MNEKEIHKMYTQIMCDLLNECKFHNFSLTDDQIKKIASKRVLMLSLIHISEPTRPY